MKHKKILIAFVFALALALAVTLAVSAVSGAAFTTFNPWVDGLFKDVCKNSIINCNIYGTKPDVWLNGGPAANGLGPDGEYFFAVLVPGGQPNPNDGGAKNLSDDYDAYTNRIFTVTDGEVSYYGGTHDLDSGGTNPPRGYCHDKRGCEPDGNPPLIRLYPYADTWNPGGVYILAICSLAEGYPVEPRDCKYDAFKVKEGPVTYEFWLSGTKFNDLFANGINDNGDYGLESWEITIKGTGYAGEIIDVIVTTDENGYWHFEKSYSFTSKDSPVAADLEVCEVLQPDWYQSAPDPACYQVTLGPAVIDGRGDLDFGNYQPVSITAYKYYDADMDGEKDASETWVEGFEFCLYDGGDTLVSADDFASGIPQDACQTTSAGGFVSWTDLKPGTYTVKEGTNPAYWIPSGPTQYTITLPIVEYEPFVVTYSAVFEFGNYIHCVGLTPGYWSNWRNHYTEEQFESLLVGTIASSISEADELLKASCEGDEALGCMRKFLLANQLTLNLTQYPDLPNPSQGLLLPFCQLPGYEGNLGTWLEEALDIHGADGTGYERWWILWVKSILDWFANLT